jgi:hypothetical protein
MTIQANFPAIKPSLMLDFASTKQLDPRITYTRASTATFYNGVTTAKAEENLALQSQTFDNSSWNVNSGVTVVANATTAPDGTTTADSLADAATLTYHYLYQAYTPVISSSYTLSCYAKDNTGQYLILSSNIGAGVYAGAGFDLVNGTVTNGSAGGWTVSSSSITSVGSGWYRCVVTIVPSTTGASFFNVARSNVATLSSYGMNSYSGTGTSVYIWGAQLEIRSAVSAYTATTTQAITNYIPVLQTAASGVARFDNNPTTGESLGLLIEESRTNLLTYSSAQSNAAWTKSEGTITSSANIAPDGTQTASMFVESSNNQFHYIRQTATVVQLTNYTASIYVKAELRTTCNLAYLDSANSNGVYLNANLATGTITSTGVAGTGAYVGSSITNVGNGWYRISITGSQNSSTTGELFLQIGPTFYQGNGFNGLFVWGAQLEAGAFATSYIPTVASQVTRAADAASMTGTNFSSWFNVGQGTVYADGNTKSNTYACLLTVSAATFPIGSGFLLRQLTTNIQFGGYGSSTNSGSVTTNSNVRSAAFYQGLNATSVANGTSVSSITNFDFTGAGTTTLYIGYLTGPSQIFNGTIKKIAYYPFAVTSAQLQALTS